MKHWLLNFLNKRNGDAYRHMTVSEISKYNKKGKRLPTEIVVHGDNNIVDLSGISAPSSTLNVYNQHVRADNLTAAELIVQNDSKHHFNGVYLYNSKMVELNVSSVKTLSLENLDDLFEMNFNDVDHLKVVNTPSLTELHTDTFDKLKEANLRSIPNLKSSSSVNVTQLSFTALNSAVLEHNGIYLLDFEKGDRTKLLESIESQFQQSKKALISWEKEGKNFSEQDYLEHKANLLYKKYETNSRNHAVKKALAA